MNNALPASWNFVPFGYPFPPDLIIGDKYPGLIIVDGKKWSNVLLPFSLKSLLSLLLSFAALLTGVTIPEGFASSMASGRAADVPLLIEGENNEPTLYMPLLGITFDNISVSELEQNFIDQLGEQSASIVWKAYSEVVATQTNDFTMSQMTADFGVSCASAQIAGVVPLSRRSPVYVSLVTTPPSTPPPNPFAPSLSVLFVPHTWDLVVGLADWKFYCYFGHLDFNCTWTPSARDIALGNTIRQMWFDIAYYGKLKSVTKILVASQIRS